VTTSPTVPTGSVRALIRGLRAEIRNWWLVGLVGWIVLPSRLPPRRGLLNRSIALRVVTVRLRDGSTLRCRVNELFAVTEVFALHTYERPDVDWRSARVIFDIGANVGAATLWMARRSPQARIVAVEPSPAALTLLRENVERNRLGTRVTVIAGAVGRTSSTAYLATDALSVSARTTASGVGVEVPVYTLDEIAQRAGVVSVDVIKIDCEGAEYDAFAGASSALMRRVNSIVGEYHAAAGHEPAELTALLSPAGLRVSLHGNRELGTFTALRCAASPH
jgi:FkbM family methyltransferase